MSFRPGQRYMQNYLTFYYEFVPRVNETKTHEDIKQKRRLGSSHAKRPHH